MTTMLLRELTRRDLWRRTSPFQQVRAVVVTRGGEGSYIYTDGGRLEIPAAPAAALVDPTGCGDAYRAGLLYGLMNDMDWETTGRVASLAGAVKAEHAGTQNHGFSADEFAERFRAAFGYSYG